MDTKELLATLRGHYIAETDQPGARDGGVFASEVAMNGSWGGPGTRRADALYAGFTSASGRILIGHEIKVSRSDWRNELTKVGKADAWADACHAWYIVAPSTDIVQVEEMPYSTYVDNLGREVEFTLGISEWDDTDLPSLNVRTSGSNATHQAAEPLLAVVEVAREHLGHLDH